MPSKSLESLFTQHGGQLHLSQALAAGISRTYFYNMRDRGIIQEITRGVYRLSALPPLSHPDFFIVSLRFPKSVICLLSALAFHKLTTHIPHAVNLAVQWKTRLPQLDFPPIQAHRFNDVSFAAGIEIHTIDNVPVKIYDQEKTLVDCFKFRNKIGMDVVLEALKNYKKNSVINTNKMMSYAKFCRVDTIMAPYLESILCL